MKKSKKLRIVKEVIRMACDVSPVAMFFLRGPPRSSVNAVAPMSSDVSHSPGIEQGQTGGLKMSYSSYRQLSDGLLDTGIKFHILDELV